MSENSASPTWWELHLRQARGERLSPEEQQLYDAEMMRWDQQEPALLDIESLKELRRKAVILAEENAHLRERLAQIEAEIRAAEQALSQQTQQQLGVQG